MSEHAHSSRRPARRPTRRRFAAFLAMLATLALSTGVIASAASLGGLYTQDLGAGTWDTSELSGVSIDYTPQWQDGTWVLAEVSVTAHQPRGFLSGDEIKVTLQVSGEAREVVSGIDEPTTTLSWSGSQFGPGYPLLTDLHQIAVLVTGADGETVISNVGDLRGSLAGYAGAVIDQARIANAEIQTSMLNGREQKFIHLDVREAQRSDLIGAFVAVVLPDQQQISGQVSRYAAAPIVAADTPDGGARITLAPAQSWSSTDGAQFHAVLATTQHLTGAGEPGAISTVSWTETEEQVENPEESEGPEESESPEGEGPEQPGDPAPTPPPATVGSALDAAGLTPGLSYDYTWGGEYTNGLGYQHTFTVTNTTSSTMSDWAVQFDTTLPPLWGADPTAPGAVELVWPLETREYDRDSGLWTIGIPTATDRTLQPGQSRNFSYHARQVPVPEVDHALFDTVITVGGHDNHVTFDIEVTTSSPFYVPWSVEVDLADYVCADSLQGRSVTFSQVTSAPVAGSSTRYLIEGRPGGSQLVRAGEPREFTFAQFNAGAPGWQQSCPEAD